MSKILDDYIVIDDVISKTYQDHLESFMHQHQQWYFQNDITFSEQHLKDLKKDGHVIEQRPGWSSMIYDPRERIGSINHLVTPILYNAISLINIKLDEVGVIRSFMSPAASKYSTRLVDKPHVDMPMPHYVCLYYVNDSDGDTVIFKKIADGIQENKLQKDLDPNTLDVLTTVSPKKGRCVIFNGLHYHASTQPTRNIRTIVNFNFT
jgi:hypothetical protein|tara:strand:+ start:42 stop:662 length:621 start_codon:yes stop_codon:yes gene_type:complete